MAEGFTAAMVIAALLGGCAPDYPDRPHLRGKVLQRVASPTSEFVAIVTRHSYGGGGGFGGVNDYVYIEGSDGAGPFEILYSPDNAPIEMTWLSADRLQIRMECGRARFWNLVAEYEPDDNSLRFLEIELVNGGVCPEDLLLSNRSRR
jgi:hypothetical protein